VGKVKIDIGFAYLIAEQNAGDSPTPELFVCLEDKETGSVTQDIVMVRPSEKTTNIECLVWSDIEDEDYTHKIEVDIRKDETHNKDN